MHDTGHAFFTLIGH